MLTVSKCCSQRDSGLEDNRRVRGAMVAKAHGWFNIVGGLWPLLHMRSFEHVFGPKTERWLVQTVAGLLLSNGAVQVLTAPSPDAVVQARRVGVGTAATLAVIDVMYAGRVRISKMYLADAVVEAGWLLMWTLSSRFSRSRGD